MNTKRDIKPTEEEKSILVKISSTRNKVGSEFNETD